MKKCIPLSVEDIRCKTLSADKILLLRRYLETGGSVYDKTDAGHAIIALTLRYGNVDAIKVFLDFDFEVNRPINALDTTPLMCALESKDFDTVQLLLTAGANPNAADKYGYTVLIRACGCAPVNIIELLLSSGASLELKAVGGISAFFYAAGLGRLDVMDTLLKWGASLDQPDTAGFTPLIEASSRGNELVVRWLLNAGANASLKVSGKTALDYAYSEGHTAIAALLSTERH